MKTRQTLGISVLLCVCAGSWPARQAAVADDTAAKRSLCFTIASGSPDGQRSAIECVVQFGPALPISAVAFGPEGKTLAVGGYREVLLWDLADAKLAKRIGMEHLAGMVHAVAFIDDGKSLAVGDGVPHQSGAVRIFNVETGEQTAVFEEPERVVYSLAATPDGKFLIAGDAGSLVHIWDLTAGKLVRTLDTHNGWVLGIALSGDGKRLVTAGADRTMRVWEVGAWKRLLRYDLPATVNAAALSPDGKTVVGAVGGDDEWALRIGRIAADLKQAARRKPVARARSTGAGMPLDIVWPAQGAVAFVAMGDHTVRAYQAATGKPLKTYRGHTDWVYCVAVTPDGSKLASGSADGTVKIFNAAGGKPLATLVQLSPRTDDWLVMTPRGHFATSAADRIQWKTADSSNREKDLTDRYHDRESVRKALAVKTAPPSASQRKGTSKPRKPAGPKKKVTTP